jgi:hypothetical protein
MQETNQRLENRILNEQAAANALAAPKPGQPQPAAAPAQNQRVQSLVNYLKQYSFTPAEIQQAQAQLKAPQPQAAKPAVARPAAAARPAVSNYRDPLEQDWNDYPHP